MGPRARYAIPVAAAIGMLMLSSSNVFAFSCERHIYNKSACPWTFAANTTYGNVWFESITCGGKPQSVPGCTGAENGPCVLQPGCTARIKYTTTGGNITGIMSITDQTGNSKGWQYTGASRCPYISHVGNTGSVSMNEPANGDYTADSCTW